MRWLGGMSSNFRGMTMRHHRWFVPRCISDPCYSCTPTRSCHRGLDKASLTPSDTSPPSPVPRDRGDRVRHLCPLRGPRTAESSIHRSPNARRKALSRAVSRLENESFDPKRDVLCERNPGRCSNCSLSNGSILAQLDRNDILSFSSLE